MGAFWIVAFSVDHRVSDYSQRTSSKRKGIFYYYLSIKIQSFKTL